MPFHGVSAPRARLLASICAGIFLASACSEPTTAAPPSPSAAQVRAAPSGVSLDQRYIQDAAVESTLSQLAQRYARRIEANGAFRNNARRQQIRIQGQRDAFLVLAAGVSAEREDWTDAGLRGIEWGLGQAGADGSFPATGDPKILGRAFFIEAAARGLLLIQEGLASATFKDRGQQALPELAIAARWLARSPGLEDAVARDTTNSNQLMVVAAALQQASLLTNDASLSERARHVAAEALSRQTSDGAFPERGGFDASYQSVSLEFLARYADRLPASPWKDQVRQALSRGAERLMRVIGPDGRVDTQGSTRTVACGSTDRGDVRRDTAVLPLRLRYLAITLEQPALATAADAVASVGQGFNHAEQCQDPA